MAVVARPISFSSWPVGSVVFANSGMITGSIMIIFGADILIAGLLAKNLEQASHA